MQPTLAVNPPTIARPCPLLVSEWPEVPSAAWTSENTRICTSEWAHAGDNSSPPRLSLPFHRRRLVLFTLVPAVLFRGRKVQTTQRRSLSQARGRAMTTPDLWSDFNRRSRSSSTLLVSFFLLGFDTPLTTSRSALLIQLERAVRRAASYQSR